MSAHTKVSQTSHAKDHFKNIASKLNAPDVVSKGVIGQMMHWREDRGFGFIAVAPASCFTKQKQLFCHFRALAGSVDDLAVVRFDVVWENGKYEASNVRQISEYQVVSENISGLVKRWDDGRSLGFIQYDSDKAWVRFPSTECLDDDVWVGLPVHFNLCRSVLDHDRLHAQEVRACPTVKVCEDLKGKVTYISDFAGFGWIVSGNTSFKFFTKDVISPLSKGAVVCFDHIQVGDMDVAARVTDVGDIDLAVLESGASEASHARLKPVSENACGVVKGWISRTFKTTVAGEEKEQVVISALACDHDFVCPASALKMGDKVDFELEWSKARKIWPVNIRVTGSSNQIPPSMYEGRHLAIRCPKRKLLRFRISNSGSEEFAWVGPKSLPKLDNEKKVGDQMSTCSTAAPLSELRH